LARGALTKLGHEVRLMPAKDVKAHVKRNKNDAADAAAIRRSTMWFVRIKSPEQAASEMNALGIVGYRGSAGATQDIVGGNVGREFFRLNREIKTPCLVVSRASVAPPWRSVACAVPKEERPSQGREECHHRDDFQCLALARSGSNRSDFYAASPSIETSASRLSTSR
jgi:hypothetical protein